MEKLVIKGPAPLKGEVIINGAKNAAVALLPAALLIDGCCTIENLPNISDIKISCEILEKLGAKIIWNNKNSVTIDSTNITTTHAPLDLTSKFRASYYIIGAMLGRMGEIEVGMPGGCKLGARPIDQHIKGFELLGVTTDVSQGKITASAYNLIGNSIYFDVISVGATINLILASVLAQGTTTLINVAKEPHIIDVADFLNTCGARIRGAGTDTITIDGVPELVGDYTYSIVPDQIEAGTFMFAAVASKGDVLIKKCIPEHLEVISAKIEEMGGIVTSTSNTVRVTCPGEIAPANITTLPYPGFPTDLQPQAAIPLTIANGTSIINESIWDSRFQYTNELIKMGAKITAQGKTAIIEGVDKLTASPIEAPDLRAGAALIIAAIIADGTTELTGVQFIDRGYENIEEKFRDLGADIVRIDD